MAKNIEGAAKVSAEARTTPSARDEASENVFAKDYLAQVDDSSKVPNEVHERNKVDVVQSALQRGLKATGNAKLSDTTIVDNRNVMLTYTVSVKPNNK